MRPTSDRALIRAMPLRLSRSWRLLFALAACACHPTLPSMSSSGGSLGDAAWPEPDDAVLEQLALTYNFKLGTPRHVWVTPDGAEVLYVRSPPRSFVSDLYAFDLASGRERRLLAAKDLLSGSTETLSTQERARRERMRQATRGITAFSTDRAGRRLLVPLSGRLFTFERQGGRVEELSTPCAALDPSLSPDGEKVAFVCDGDLFVADRQGEAAPLPLTRRDSDRVSHGTAEFVAQEEMHRMRGYWWSPDSRSIAYQKSDTSKVEVLHIADAVHPEQPPQAFRYPRAGTPNAQVTLGVVPVSGGETRWIEWDREQFPYLAHVTWSDNSPLTLVVQNRQQNEAQVLAVESLGAPARRLLTEKDDLWLNLDDSGMPRWTADGAHFLWSTERNGAWELELRDREGRFQRTLVPASLGYRGVAGIDQDREQVWVEASPDPRRTNVYRVPLMRGGELEAASSSQSGKRAPGGGAPVRVSEAAGEFSVRVAKRSSSYVLLGRHASGQLEASVWHPDGTQAGHLPSVAETPARLPRPEYYQVEVGGREHQALIVRPRSYQPGKRYPVLLSVYGGPGVNVVRANPYAYLLDQWFADGGFIVVKSDGRGTPRRGRNWERALRGRPARIPLEDQLAVVRKLAAERAELDLNRMGVFGWSYGGYLSAMAVLLHPELIRAAVAGAPVTDWRDYDTHYTERYLGLPKDEAAAYDASSVLTHAHQLRRPLLLIHGTTDDNVYFTHSLKFSQALFRAGKPFELLPLAGFTHMVPDPVVKKALSRRILAFFRQHLQGVTPLAK